MSMMDGEEAKVAFVAATVDMATGPTMVQAITKAPAMEEVMMVPVARLMANQAQKKVSEAAQPSTNICPPYPPPSTNGSSSSDNERGARKPKKYLGQKPKKKPSSSLLEDRKASRGNDRSGVSISHQVWLKRMRYQRQNHYVIHPVNVVFAHAIKWRIYLLHNRF